jgi:hypothetical protein
MLVKINRDVCRLGCGRGAGGDGRQRHHAKNSQRCTEYNGSLHGSVPERSAPNVAERRTLDWLPTNLPRAVQFALPDQPLFAMILRTGSAAAL